MSKEKKARVGTAKRFATVESVGRLIADFALVVEQVEGKLSRMSCSLVEATRNPHRMELIGAALELGVQTEYYLRELRRQLEEKLADFDDESAEKLRALSSTSSEVH